MGTNTSLLCFCPTIRIPHHEMESITITFVMALVVTILLKMTLAFLAGAMFNMQPPKTSKAQIDGSMLHAQDGADDAKDDSDSDSDDEDLEPASVVYPRSFLIQFEHIFTERPDDLPEHEILTGKVEAEEKPVNVKQTDVQDMQAMPQAKKARGQSTPQYATESDYNSSTDDDSDSPSPTAASDELARLCNAHAKIRTDATKHNRLRRRFSPNARRNRQAVAV